MALKNIKKINVLFISLLDFSSLNDRNIYTDLLSEFFDDGHSLYIVSPEEKADSSDEKKILKNRINIIKPRIGNITKSSLIKKGIATLKIERKLYKAITKSFSNIHFDLILYTTPPVTIVGLVKKLKEKHNSMTYLLLKDIFPQNAVDLNILSKKGIKGLIYKYFKHKEKKLYQVSDFIGCMSDANKAYLLKENDWIDEEKVEVNPNSERDEIYSFDLKLKENFLIKHKIPLDKKLFVYGGNLGKPQGIYFILDVIKANEVNSNSFFIIIGSGTEYKKIEKFLFEQNILNTTLMKSTKKTKYIELLSYCDVGLVFLDNRFTIPNFPSRIITYMKQRKPLLIASDNVTDIGPIAKSNGFGEFCLSNDVKTFNHLVRLFSTKFDLTLMGENAYQFFKNHYTSKNSYNIIMKRVKEKMNGF
jgi:hypothetical protein